MINRKFRKLLIKELIFMDSDKIKIIYAAEVDSTNLHASALLSGGDINPPFTIYTGFQKKGRGQGENLWCSERNRNLLCSICIEPGALNAAQSFCLSKIAALSVHSLLDSKFSGVEIKWPNDILLNRRKIAGILIDNTFQGDMVMRSILGIGLNVNQIQFPDFNTRAISMKMESDSDFNIVAVLKELIEHFSKWYSLLESGKTEAIESAYLSHLYLYQQTSNFIIDGNVIVKGNIKKIMDDGRMLFEDESGKESFYGFKEIAFI
jgi:BirA family biotin operon repressor/biotin-[acetyl-CoA-carboxylase] ligase